MVEKCRFNHLNVEKYVEKCTITQEKYGFRMSLITQTCRKIYNIWIEPQTPNETGEKYRYSQEKWDSNF
jgi:hypothetical protein